MIAKSPKQEIFSMPDENLLDFVKRLKFFDCDMAIFSGPKIIVVIIDGVVRPVGDV